ncbi:helix-turn-helix domain-containing protein [Vallitalea sp.]|uniref:helix-turn-helix domain-containing protein n=1 Tax=Vallitalea sp. TaxID=1882829 RepID=UPI0025DC73EC|nr:AraC family transcriptional regulator [Vallitalea sp.]MCT4688431.1 AraC family transcriptional regulator [Vallitalea sp.]
MQEEQTFTICYDNNNCDFKKYIFSSAISFEFYNIHSEDGLGGKHKGMNLFRIDFTKVGRFECEFPNHTFSFRGENEITMMATQENEEWILGSSFPVDVYIGCALLIKLDKMSNEDKLFLGKFHIDILNLISTMKLNNRWYKFTDTNKLLDLFNDIYNAHMTSNQELILLKILEMLVFISKSEFHHSLNKESSDYFSGEQVKKVKSIHGIITKNYNKKISLEKIVRENGIGYSTFNKIFKNIYGESPYQYLKKIRMNFAAQKLHETELSILEIAVCVGYNNPSKFSDAFKSIFGLLPSTFRKQKNGME